MKLFLIVPMIVVVFMAATQPCVAIPESAATNPVLTASLTQEQSAQEVLIASIERTERVSERPPPEENHRSEATTAPLPIEAKPQTNWIGRLIMGAIAGIVIIETVRNTRDHSTDV